MTTEDRLHFIEIARESLRSIQCTHEASWIIDHLISLGISSSGEVRAELQTIVDRRRGGEPLAYIFGHWAFRDLEFDVGPGALIPRPETEELVEFAVEAITADSNFLEKFSLEGVRAADLGAGTGCLGIGFFHALLQKTQSRDFAFHPSVPNALFLVERSSEAAAWCRKNLARHEVLLAGVSTHLFEGSWNDFSETNLDILLSNPPYLTPAEYAQIDPSVRHYEPAGALVPEGLAIEDGLTAYRELLLVAARSLKVGGWLWFEFGIDQDKRIAEMAKSAGIWAEGRIFSDLQGKPRFFATRLASTKT